MGHIESDNRNMKGAVFLLAFSCALALVYSEGCTSDSDCAHEVCDTNYAVKCVRGSGRQGICTCEPSRPSGDKCTSQADCYKEGRCSTGWHCIDNKCYCRHH